MRKLLIVTLVAAVSSSTPLLAGHQNRSVVDAKQYGIIPNDHIDDTDNLTLLIAYSGSNTTIQLDAGDYDIGAGTWTHPIPIVNKTDIWIVGTDTTRFVVHGFDITQNGSVQYGAAANWYGGAFEIRQSNAIQLQDFSVVMDRPAFTQTTLVGFTGSISSPVSLTLQTTDAKYNLPAQTSIWIDSIIPRYPANYPVYAGAPYTEGAIWHPYSANTQPTIQGTTAGGLQTFTLNLPSSAWWQVQNLIANSYIMIQHQDVGGVGVYVIDSNDVSLTDVRIHSSAGMAFIAAASTNLSYHHCSVVPEDSSTFLSSNKDAFHFQGCRGSITLDNCHVAYSGDDAYSATNLWMRVLSMDSANSRIEIESIEPTDPLPFSIRFNSGDLVQLKSPDLGAVHGTGTITNATGGGPVWLTISNVSQGFWSSVGVGDAVELRSWLPSAFNLEGASADSVRGRGCLVTLPNAAIKGCTFERCTGQAVLVDVWFSQGVSWRRSGVAPDHLLVSDCTIRNLNTGTDADLTKGVCAIDVIIAGSQGVLSPSGACVDVSVNTNYLSHLDRGGIRISAVDSVSIKGNTFYEVSRLFGSGRESYLVYLDNCANGIVSGNQVIDPWVNGYGSTGSSNILVSGNGW